MATRSRFSTSTVFGSERSVPWLAAQGPLAYSPEEPPATDYFFQYSWILRGIFDPKVNLCEHRYFGSRLKSSGRFLFDFWGNIRKGNGATRQRYSHLGVFSDIEVKAPIAAYHHVRKLYDTAGSVLIQHGSYQWISDQDQPDIERGQVLLYRGIAENKEEIMAVISGLLESVEIELEGESAVEQALYLWRDSASEFADCLIGASYKTLGCRATASFDAKALKLPDFISP